MQIKGLTQSAGVQIDDGQNIVLGTTIGTQIGTSSSQKLSFYGATPIALQLNTTDLRQALINLGLYASGGATPLNLNGGALTAATLTGNGAAITNISQGNVVGLSTALSGKATSGPITASGLTASQSNVLLGRSSTASGPIEEFTLGSYLSFSSSTLIVSGLLPVDGGSFNDGATLTFGSTTGTKFGTATTQKLAFYNATPIVQPSSTTDLRQALINLGLYATGGASPLNLNGGALTAGISTINGSATTGVENVLQINSAAPYAAITVNNSSNRQSNFILSSNGVQKWNFGSDFGADGTKDFFVYDATGLRNPLYITVGGDVRLGGTSGYSNTQAVTIKQTGNVLIGTITDDGVNKVQVNGSIASGSISLSDAANIIAGTTTGTKIGTSATQKLGFFNATPVVQQAQTIDLKTILVTLGFYSTTAGTTPLNLGAGALTSGTYTITDANNIVLGTTTGTKIGTATTQKLGFYNATPIVQPVGTTDLRVALINLGLLATGGITPLDLNGGALTNGTQTFTDGSNMVFGTTTGTKIGTATNQKIAFFNATPIIQPISTTDLRLALINLGLLATGGATPLNLNGGNLTAARIIHVVQTDTYAATKTIDASTGDLHTINLTGNITLSLANGTTDGEYLQIRFIQDTTGSRILTMGGTNIEYGTKVPSSTLVLDTAANSINYVAWRWQSSNSKWRYMSIN